MATVHPKATVSVVVPSYNAANDIGKAIDSILEQTLKPSEIIVVDDGSTDDTREKLASYMQKGQIKYFLQENKGPGAARNKGIWESTGEFIAFLDADDTWLPMFLEHSLAFLRKNNFDWTCTAFARVYEDRKVEKRIDPNDCFFNPQTHEIQIIKNRGLFWFSDLNIWTGTILCSKKALQKVDGYDESILIGEDWDLYFRLEESGCRCGYLNEILAFYIVKRESLTTKARPSGKGIEDFLRVGKKHALIWGLDKSYIRKSYSEFLWSAANQYKKIGKKQHYILCLIRSVIVFPNVKRILNKLVKLFDKKLFF